MRIIVCIKQVPNTTQINTDPQTGTLIRDGVPSIINPDDRRAIQTAVSMKKEHSAKVIALSLGPPQAEAALWESLALGCDESYLITGKAFAGSDTLATAYLLSISIKQLGGADLIFCGRQAIDGDTAQVGPELAERLHIPQITYVSDLSLSEKKITAKRKLEDGYEIVTTTTPCLLTILQKNNEIQLPSLPNVLTAFHDKKIRYLHEKDFFEADSNRFGLSGSPTQIFRVFTPKSKGKGKKINAAPKEAAQILLRSLKEDGWL